MSRGVRLASIALLLLACGSPVPVIAQGTWSSRDIGQVGVTGSATITTNRIKVMGEGIDIWSTADGCHYVYQSLAGDGQITARVASLDAVDGWTKGGVMIRQSLDPGAANAALVATPSNGISFQQRITAGGPSAYAAIYGAAPVWLRLARTGGSVTAYKSTDGTTWALIATADVRLKGAVYAGIAVSSNRASRLATGVFDSVKISTTVVPPPSGPVAAWAFDEGSGGMARDSVGANHGTLSGATWTAGGRYGGALTFDGVAANVAVPDASTLDLSTAATVEAWVLPATLTGWRGVVAKESATGAAYSLHANSAAGRPTGVLNNGRSDVEVSSSTPLTLGAWTHLAVTYDGQLARLFVNGKQAGSVSLTGPLAQTGGALRIGGNAVLGEWFQGRIDDVRVYKRALAGSEIATDRNIPVRPMTLVDVAAPVVAVTAPVVGAAVTGTVTLAATATDDVAVASVQFRVNGANVGLADTAAPFTTTWNTAGVAGGTYTVTAVGRDAAGHESTSAPVSVTVSTAPAVVNVKSVTFTSPGQTAMEPNGQPVVSSYVLEVWTAGSNTAIGTPYRTSDLGKPATTSTTLTVDQQTFFATLTKGQQFVVTVRAIGPGGSARSSASPAFSMQ